MRWKNGLGETAEIAIAPPGAPLDDFDWRISMARIEATAPFSAFPGVDRTLAVLDGEGLALEVDGRAAELTPRSPPFAFAGESVAAATLLGGAVTDLNVMTRRSRFSHRVRRLHGPAQVALAPAAAAVVIFCASGSARIVSPDTATLGPRDALVLEPPPAAVDITGDAEAHLVIAEISRA